MKFAIRKYDGTPVSFWRVEPVALALPEAKARPGHHIIVVDRSGSMCGDITEVKATLEKVLTLEEFNLPEMQVSLISYSSHGDVKLHFSRAKIADVMQTNSSYLKEVRGIRATAMTCISQSLKLAETLVRDDEATCISLHTDGYANDLSPSAEKRDVDAAVLSLKKHPAVFVNTVAYRDYCDFQFLSSISNRLSGSTIRARTTKQVYEALHAGFSQLAGTSIPTLEIPIGKADFLTFLSSSDKKVLGGRESLEIRGCGIEGVSAYRYYKVSEEAYRKDASEEITNSPVLFAFIRASLAGGLLNQAKYALCASRAKKFILHNYKALTSQDLADFAEATEFRIWNTVVDEDCGYGVPGFGGATILDFLEVLNSNRNSIRINLRDIQLNYKRRGLKRVAGVRREDGSLEEPWLKTVLRNPEDWVSPSSVEVNRSSPTANITFAQPVELVNVSSGEVIHEVAGIPLSLKDYKAYTVIGDGALNIPFVNIRVSSKKAWADLGAFVSGEFDPSKDVRVNLSDYAVVGDKSSALPSGSSVKELQILTAYQKLLSASLKGASEDYTAEQIAELKRHYLSPALYVNFPTTNSYVKLEDALSTGEVDSRITFSVEFGTTELTSASKLKSGNAFFQSKYSVTKDGKAVEKPTLPVIWEDGVVVTPIVPKKASKPNKADEIMAGVFAGFFGVSSLEWEVVKKYGGASFDELKAGVLKVGSPAGVLASIEGVVDRIYSSFKDLVFQVGATGLLPDGVEALDAEGLVKKYSELSLSKDEKEGTFFELPDGGLVTVYASTAYFSR